MEKILTVTVPAYNVEQYLGGTLESMCNVGNIEDIEIIVVNDGSSDNTIKIAEEYHFKYPDSIVIIDKRNGGHGSAINSGAAAARGKYFKVIDGDDWVDTAQFELFIDKLKNIDVDLILNPFNKVFVDCDKTEQVNPSVKLEEKSYKFQEHICTLSDFYCMHSITFKTEVYKKTDLIITEKCFYVDMEFILYPIDRIKSFKYLDLCVYQYRLGRPGQSVSMKSKIKNRNMHKQVIHDLVENCSVKERNNAGNNVDRFVIQKIVTLTNIQYSIYLSSKANKETYKEMIEFKSYIESVVNPGHFNGVSKILHNIPIAYWLLGLRYRKKYNG